MHSLDYKSINNIIPSKKKDAEERNLKAPTKGLAGIEEGKVGDEDIDDEPDGDKIFNKGNDDDDGSGAMNSDSDGSDSGESSIDMDGDEDDENKLYAQILSE